MSDWIFISPHLDDVVLSCGGLITEQMKAGKKVEIWTICAGTPPAGDLTPFAESLHMRWGTGPDAILTRRREDKEACRILGVKARHMDIPDCIYRRQINGEPLINENSDLFSTPHQAEAPLLMRLTKSLENAFPAGACIVSPLAIGGHIDHRLVKAALQALGRPIWYYADYPYIGEDIAQLSSHIKDSWRAFSQSISAQGLSTWQEAAKAYASQISTFWSSAADMCHHLEKYWRIGGGSTLWQPE